MSSDFTKSLQSLNGLNKLGWKIKARELLAGGLTAAEKAILKKEAEKIGLNSVEQQRLLREARNDRVIDRHLTVAREATNYVIKTLETGAGTWDDKIDAVDRCVKKMRKTKLRKTDPGPIASFRAKSNRSARYKCGNCGEMATSAFVYLYDKDVWPVERVTMVGKSPAGKEYDHAFCIIGRIPSGTGDFWGPHAVICDPWAYGFRDRDMSVGAYSSNQFSNIMSGIMGAYMGDDKKPSVTFANIQVVKRCSRDDICSATNPKKKKKK